MVASAASHARFFLVTPRRSGDHVPITPVWSRDSPMPSPDVLDFARLLAPIPGDKPVGADLRANAGPTSPYYQVKDGRNNARAAERRMEGGAEDPTPPDWKVVVTSATKALTESTKDLELAAYLIEALCRTNGFAGLRDGFKLA